jgi:hypothetical protein
MRLEQSFAIKGRWEGIVLVGREFFGLLVSPDRTSPTTPLMYRQGKGQQDIQLMIEGMSSMSLSLLCLSRSTKRKKERDRERQSKDYDTKCMTRSFPLSFSFFCLSFGC